LTITKDKHDEPPGAQKIPATVIIDGPDTEIIQSLLREDLSHVVEGEPGTSFPLENEVQFRIRNHMASYGVLRVLVETTKMDTPHNPEDDIRERVIGLRGAKANNLLVNGERKSDVYRGTFVSVIQGKTFDDDMFELVYDNDGERDVLDLAGFYDAIRLYLEVGETVPEWNSEDWAQAKRKASVVVEKDLVQNSLSIQERKKELDSARSISSVLGKPPEAEKGKKRSREEISSSVAKKKQRNPKSFLGHRVAKYFPGAEEGDEEVLYFGTIDYISNHDDDEVWWHVQYDDDDQEDWDESDLRRGIKLYARHKDEDTKDDPV